MTENSAKTRRDRILHISIYATIIIVIIAGFIFFLSSPAANNPLICGNLCHNMNPQYKSWQKSSHASISCKECHISSSYSQIVKEKLFDYSKRFATTVLNTYDKPINKNNSSSQEMLVERCLRCHKNEYRRFNFSVGINMDHNKHKNAKIACPVCHNRVAHPDAEKYSPISTNEKLKKFKYKNFLTMKDGCWRCHSESDLFNNKATLAKIKNGKTPPSECVKCHNKDFPMPEGHREPSKWRAIHKYKAKGNYEKCLKCHDKGKKFDYDGEVWCIKCHANMSKILKVVNEDT